VRAPPRGRRSATPSTLARQTEQWGYGRYWIAEHHFVAVASSPRIVEGTLFPTPFRSDTLILSKRFGAAGSVLQQPGAQAPDFADQLDDVIRLVRGEFETDDGVHLCATPGEGAEVQLWLFGSSGGESASVAGARGLPFVANYHVSPGTTLEAVDAYRAAFRPSSFLDEPYVVVSADVLVAATDSEAEYLASPFAQWVHSIRSGLGAVPYPDPDRSRH
jgi:alkanesulfonate monooxygenase SsuD/methylene tetrahydromethanopterin reductase-like flavin-dependent oxidoreductase (luciferase family)